MLRYLISTPNRAPGCCAAQRLPTLSWSTSFWQPMVGHYSLGRLESCGERNAKLRHTHKARELFVHAVLRNVFAFTLGTPRPLHLFVDVYVISQPERCVRIHLRMCSIDEQKGQVGRVKIPSHESHPGNVLLAYWSDNLTTGGKRNDSYANNLVGKSFTRDPASRLIPRDTAGQYYIVAITIKLWIGHSHVSEEQ